MPAKTEKQRRFFGAELARRRAGEETQTDLSTEELREMASKSETPPSGVQGFTQVPDPTSDPVDPPDAFTQTPNRSDPETTTPSSDRRAGSATKGHSVAVQDFGSGAEQRGVTRRDLRVEVGIEPSSSGVGATNSGVQSFSDSEV